MAAALLCAAAAAAALRPLPQSAPNVWGGAAARPKGDSGNLFAFSGLDGTTVESSLAFVAIFTAEPYALLFRSQSPRTLHVRGPAGLSNGTVLVSTGDTFVAEFASASEQLKMVWAAYDQLVGALPAGGAVELEGAEPYKGAAAHGKCMVAADAHESFALCVSGSRWGLGISLVGGQAGTAAAVQLASQRLAHPAEIDETIDKRLQIYSTGLLPAGLPAKYERLAGKAVSVMRVNALSPEGKIAQFWSTPDRTPHQWMWLWDSCYHAMAMNLLTLPPRSPNADSPSGQPTPGDVVGWAYIKSVLLGADASGAVSIERTPSSVGTKVLQTQPPLLAWATAENYAACTKRARSGDGECEARLAFALPRLEGYIRWDMTQRRDRSNKTKLYFWTKGTESGMDNSQRWDFTPGRGEKATEEMSSLLVTDLSVFVAREAAFISQLATAIKNTTAARHWQGVASTLSQQIHETLWDESVGLYMDRFSGPAPKPGFSTVKAVTGLMPMWLPDLPAERLPHLLDAMNDEVHGFNSSAPLATVSLDTKSFSTDMWRGPMWMNTNWHVALALIDCGENQTAAKLLRRTLDVVLDNYEKYGVIFEFYDAKNKRDTRTLMRKGKPMGPVRDYHWSAAITLLMLHKLHDLGAQGAPSVQAKTDDLVIVTPVDWKETTGIAMCGDEYFTDFKSDPFGGGMDGKCAMFPMGTPVDHTVEACKSLCAPAAQCVGFTWYTAAKELASGHQNKTSCCFRAGSVARKPPCDGAPTCRGTRCYEKPAPPPPPSPPHTLPKPYTSVVFEPFLGGAPCWRVPSLVAVSPTHLLAFAGSRCTPGDGCSPLVFHDNQTDSRARIGLRRSTDGGKSWLPVQIIGTGAHCRFGEWEKKHPGMRTFTPNAVYHPPTDTVHIMWANGFATRNYSFEFLASTTHGETWFKKAQPLPLRGSLLNAGDNGLLVATGNGVVLSNGRIILMSMVWPDKGAYLVVSDNAGSSFHLHPVGVNLKQSQEPQAVEIASGVFLRGRNPNHPHTVSQAAISKSFGEHWTSIPLLHRGLRWPLDATSCAGGLASTRPAWTNSTEPPKSDVMFFSHANDAQRKNGTVFRSVDGGQRWEAVLQVTDASGAADASYAYNALTTLAHEGQVTTLGNLYETGDETECTAGCSSCMIAYKLLELKDGF